MSSLPEHTSLIELAEVTHLLEQVLEPHPKHKQKAYVMGMQSFEMLSPYVTGALIQLMDLKGV